MLEAILALREHASLDGPLDLGGHLLGERVQVVQGRKKQIDVLLDDFERVRNSSGPDGAFQTASFG